MFYIKTYASFSLLFYIKTYSLCLPIIRRGILEQGNIENHFLPDTSWTVLLHYYNIKKIFLVKTNLPGRYPGRSLYHHAMHTS